MSKPYVDWAYMIKILRKIMVNLGKIYMTKQKIRIYVWQGVALNSVANEKLFKK